MHLHLTSHQIPCLKRDLQRKLTNSLSKSFIFTKGFTVDNVIKFVEALLIPYGFRPLIPYGRESNLYHNGHADLAKWYLNTKRDHLNCDERGIPRKAIVDKIQKEFPNLFINAGNDASGDVLTWSMSFDKYALWPYLKPPEPVKEKTDFQIVEEIMRRFINRLVKTFHEEDVGFTDWECEEFALPNNQLIGIDELIGLWKKCNKDEEIFFNKIVLRMNGTV